MRLIYINCSAPDHKAFSCLAKLKPLISADTSHEMGNKINDTNQLHVADFRVVSNPKLGCAQSSVRCDWCGAYGHVEQSCRKKYVQSQQMGLGAQNLDPTPHTSNPSPPSQTEHTPRHIHRYHHCCHHCHGLHSPPWLTTL